VRIVHPHRPALAQRDVGEALAKARDEVQARLNELAQLVVGRGRPVEDGDRCDVQPRPGLLEVQERRVECRDAVTVGDASIVPRPGGGTGPVRASLCRGVAPIAHLDIDAFYASVELLRRPELRGLPVIVSGSGPRAVVTTASYEARRFGIGSAMPTARARRLCPDAVLVPPDFAAYKEASRGVMTLVRRAVDRVEVVGMDEAYLDLVDLVAPRAAMRRLVSDIREATGLDCSIGIGPNRIVAKVASDAEKPRGFVCLTREQACQRFAGHPPGLVPGIGPKTAARLEEMGITTLRALAATPVDALVARFGANHGPDLQRRARFEASARLTPVRTAHSESRETTFDYDISDAAKLEEILADLAVQLCERLAKQDRRGRNVAIKVRLSDFTTITRARTIAEATNDPAVVAGVALELLREYAPARPVRLLGVRVATFERIAVPGDADQLALPL
jgi:DNA polymerase-4